MHTSNRIAHDWGRYLGDATIATTMRDLLIHRYAMLEFEGRYNRPKEAAARFANTPQHAQSPCPARSS